MTPDGLQRKTLKSSHINISKTVKMKVPQYLGTVNTLFATSLPETLRITSI